MITANILANYRHPASLAVQHHSFQAVVDQRPVDVAHEGFEIGGALRTEVDHVGMLINIQHQQRNDVDRRPLVVEVQPIVMDAVSIGAVCCCGCALPVAAVGGLAIWKGGGLFKKAFGGIQKAFKFFADFVEKVAMGKMSDVAAK